jgi:cell division protein FtsB
MNLLHWAVAGNLLALLAVLIEPVISTYITDLANKRVEDASREPHLDIEQEQWEAQVTLQRVQIQKSRNKRERITKFAIATILVISAAMLTGDAMMNEKTRKDPVTAEQLDAKFVAIKEDQSELKQKVKKLEDRVFPPPNGPGGELTQEQQDIIDLKALCLSLDRRIKNIHEIEIPAIYQAQLEELRARVTELELKQIQRPAPGY